MQKLLTSNFLMTLYLPGLSSSLGGQWIFS